MVCQSNNILIILPWKPLLTSGLLREQVAGGDGDLVQGGGVVHEVPAASGQPSQANALSSSLLRISPVCGRLLVPGSASQGLPLVVVHPLDEF